MNEVLNGTNELDEIVLQKFCEDTKFVKSYVGNKLVFFFHQ